jgi:hypothetical protein
MTDSRPSPQLKEYFVRNPGVGALLGYGKVPMGNTFAFEGVLILEWTDSISTVAKEFLNVFAFTQFLKENPGLAQCIKYEGK